MCGEVWQECGEMWQECGEVWQECGGEDQGEGVGK